MIIYKIFFYTNTQEENTSFVQSAGGQKTTAVPLDTFELLLNYPDPFLKNEKRKVTTPSDNQTSAPTKKTDKSAEQVTVNWPKLKYEGSVKQVKEGVTLAIVNINGTSKFMKIGETVDNIKLIQIYNDSIIVNFQTQKRTIKK
jgi:hypothetical protein